jgi:hypothetical protein
MRVSFLLVFLASMVSAAQVTRTVSPNVATIGDVLTYTIEAVYEEGVGLVSVPEADSFSPFEFRDHNVVKEKQNGLWTAQLEYQLALFDTGVQRIPTQNIGFKRNGKPFTLTVPAIQVRIDTLLSDDPYDLPELRGTKPPFILQIEWKGVFIFLLKVLVVLLIIIAAAVFVWRRVRPRQQRIHDIQDTRSPDEIALDELKDLLDSRLIEKNEIKHHYLIITEILKDFLSRVFNEHISEMTTFEAIAFLNQRVSGDVLQDIRFVFETSDLIKFAQHSVASHVHEDCVQALRRAIAALAPTKTGETDAV